MDESQRERELVISEDAAANASQRSVVIAGATTADSYIQFPQGEPPTINISDGSSAFFGDRATVNYNLIEGNIQATDELKGDLNKVKKDVGEIKGIIKIGERVKRDVGQVKKDVEETKCDVGQVKEAVDEVKCDVGQVKKDVEEVKCDVGQVKEDVGEVKGDMEGMKGNLEEVARGVEEVKAIVKRQEITKMQSKPYTDTDIDELKGRYKVQYQKHSIHKVDSNGRIVMEAVNVNDFAVKLKINESRPAAVTFRDETRRHFENLEGMTGNDIELHELLNDHDKRIILVSGIAAIGKSVLMKQLAFSWANNEMYTQFKLCIIMECREINNFVAKEGAHLKRHELFSEFLKTKFEYDLGGGVSTLILLDGLDELCDINTDDSMIWELLDVNNTKYAMAKIILTGRPHVEGKLDRNDKDTGGIKRFEIQGLNDEQKRNYVKKIASCEKDIANINRTIDSSEQCSQVTSIPGFLNTLSCVAVISGGETLKSVAELYVWLLYLLLKEHVQKKGPSQKLCSDVFKEYSNALEILCQICHELLSKNTIIFEGDVKSRLLNCGKGSEFLEGLFADISVCRTKKYQFKHLSIMEFLSAVHICHMKNRIDIIKHNLRNEFYQVAVFSCQLIGGYYYDGIIKDMFGNDKELNAITVEHFLPSVLGLVVQCINHELDEYEQQQQLRHLFQLSIDIITCFINKDVSNKNFIISTVKALRYKLDELYIRSMRKVSELCGHLSTAFQINDKELKDIFENFLANLVEVDDVKSLTCVKYLPNVAKIYLNEMKINNSFCIRSEANAAAKWKEVVIVRCELADDEIFHNTGVEDHQLNELVIGRCKLNKYSFINVCNWALASVNYLILRFMDNIEHSWWEELVGAIQNAKEKNNGIFALRTLVIYHCTQKISKDIQMKIIKCGVQLTINTLRVELPFQSDDAECDPQSYNQRLPLSPPDSTLYNPESTASVPPLHSAVEIPIGLEHSIPGASITSQRLELAPPEGLTPSTSDGSHHPQFTDDIEEWVVIDVCYRDNGNVSCSTYWGDDNKKYFIDL